jgi:cyclopropane fatty-acyl-phospholipid synthase-like methyltransferase
VESVLDLGTGTGSLALELIGRGYDLIGVDSSEEMLSRARERAEALGVLDRFLLLCQDMTEFELYGTVEAVVSCLDGINHLTGKGDLAKCFSVVHNYLVPDGLFLFDVNSPYKFENIYADRSYVMEEQGGVCIWQNNYDEKKKICDFYITLFEECEDGRYERYDEEQRERMYTLSEMKRMLEKSNLEFIGAYSDFEFTEATDMDERIYIVARCKK